MSKRSPSQDSGVLDLAAGRLGPIRTITMMDIEKSTKEEGKLGWN